MRGWSTWQVHALCTYATASKLLYCIYRISVRILTSSQVHLGNLHRNDSRNIMNVIYCISLKSRHTSKSRRPRNVTTYICQLVPINAALEILPHGKGLTAISVCAQAFYVHTTRLVIEAVYAHGVSISVDAALEIEPPSNCRRTKQSLEIKSRRSEISRKYGTLFATQRIIEVMLTLWTVRI